MARWVGVSLILLGSVATLWLAATGRLELYIHPRYTVFAIVLAVLGAALSIAAMVLAPTRDGHGGHGDGLDDARDSPELDHRHEHDGDHQAGSDRRSRVTTVGRLGVLVAAAVALLVIPPATLTAATTQNRELSAVSNTSAADAPSLVGVDSTTFTVKDWSALLRSGGADTVAGQRADVTGYVLDTGSGPDRFHLVRLLVSCCAVDAQPLGVPVALTGWADEVEPNQWLRIEGEFTADPSVAGDEPAVLVPDQVEPIDEPAEPYVF